MRRNLRAGTDRCTEPYLAKIEMIDSTACDGTSGSCSWEGVFGVVAYNTQPDGTDYDWSVSIGTDPEGHVDETYKVWVSSNVSVVITVSCEITYGGKTSMLSADFVTNHAGAQDEIFPQPR